METQSWSQRAEAGRNETCKLDRWKNKKRNKNMMLTKILWLVLLLLLLLCCCCCCCCGSGSLFSFQRKNITYQLDDEQEHRRLVLFRVIMSNVDYFLRQSSWSRRAIWWWIIICTKVRGINGLLLYSTNTTLWKQKYAHSHTHTRIHSNTHRHSKQIRETHLKGNYYFFFSLFFHYFFIIFLIVFAPA